VRPVINSLWNVRFKNWKCILLITIVHWLPHWMNHACVIFLTGKFVSKHFIQLRIRNKDRPISPDKQCPMRLVNSFCFSKTFVIYLCLRSKSSFFDKCKITYYTLQRQRINKHVLALTLTLIYGFYRGVSTLIVFVLLK
jgi:hypothetical protein